MRSILLRRLHTPSLRGGGCFHQRRWLSAAVATQFSTGDIVHCVKDWFKSSPHIHTDHSLDVDRIFEILRSPSNDDLSLRLSRLRLRLSEEIVLRVLSHRSNDVVSSIEFFNWASRQPGFCHSRATFYAYFKLLRRSGIMPDFSIHHSFRLCDALVIGYSVAGHPEIALQHFSNMRFKGLDLDSFGYRVLLNALVEEGYFDTVDVIVDQMSSRGFLCSITHSILVKSFCKQGRFIEAEQYFRDLLKTDDNHIRCSSAFSLLVDALCSHNSFHHAARLLDEIRELGTVCMDRAYSIWIRALIRAGNLHGAMHFVQKLNSLGEGCVIEVFRYNSLVLNLLRKNRLVEVVDVLIEMTEQGVSPDKGTMSAVLCFFCKAGMVDVALELYRSRSEISLTPTAMAYNCLINTLCEKDRGDVDQAYEIFKASMHQGHFPGRKTLHLLAQELCKNRKLNNMKELAHVAFDRNLRLSRVVYDRFMSAFSDDGRVEDCLLMHEELRRAGIGITASMFISLIRVAVRSKKGGMAAKLLIEMQEKGYVPTRRLYRDIICCLCGMERDVNNFFNLLRMQLFLVECRVDACELINKKVEAYNYFIDGAGHAGTPELARVVYERMEKDGVMPTVHSNILMLQCYLKNGKFSDAVKFFGVLQEKGQIRRKLYHTLIVGLCRAKKGDSALLYLEEMKTNEIRPSIHCYEQVIHNMCTMDRYEKVVELVREFMKSGRRLTSFLGNVLLLNALESQELYEAWALTRDVAEEMPDMKLLGELIGIFSGRVRMTGQIKTLDEVIEKCYPPDLYTYNILLRVLVTEQVDDAQEMVDRMCRRGYQPDKWTCRILVSGYLRAGRVKEAKKWVELLEATER